MAVEALYHWLGLRLEPLRTGWIAVRWRDERSHAWSSVAEPQRDAIVVAAPPTLGGIAPGLLVPREVAQRMASSFWPDPLAVFVDAAAPFRGLPLERLIGAVVDACAPGGVLQLVRWLRRRPTSRRRFRLPLRVVALGAHGIELEQRLSGSFVTDPAVAEFGLQLELLTAAGLETRFTDLSRPVDVVVAPEDQLRTTIRAAARGLPPRLFVAVGEPGSDPAWTATVRVPPGASLAWFLAPSPVDAVRELIYALVHDQPLHAAVRLVIAGLALERDAARLASDPQANQSLRVSDALASVLAEADRATLQFDPGDVDQFVRRLAPDEAAELAGPLRLASDRYGPLRQAASTMYSLALTFDRESSGLVPMAHARAELTEAMRARPSAASLLSQISQSPKSVALLRRHQQRTVDIALLRLGPVPEPGTVGAGSEVSLLLGEKSVLRAGTDYRIRVHAGTPGLGSLLTEKPPSLDPLLPDPPDAEGHRLEFVVFGHDFTVLSDTRVERYLPLLGGTEPAYFDIRAPEFPEDAVIGTIRCRARIAVYYQGNLIQSFLLHALVATSEAVVDERVLRADLEFSQSERLTNLDEIGTRSFSIAANETGDGTHWLMLRGTALDGEVRLTERQIDNEIKRFRSTLLEATFSNVERQEQRFQLDGPRNWNEFDRYVRQLARAGSALFQRVFTSSPATLRPLLNAIGESSDKFIQVALHNSSFAFPWSAVYDRMPPDDDQAVCLGGLSHEELQAGAPLEFRCGHTFMSEAFCVYGFWGIRQRLEYLLPGRSDPLRVLGPSPTGGRICLAIGDVRPQTKVLVDRLSKDLGPGSVRLLTTEDPLDVLWSNERPAEMVVLGHLHVPAQSPDDPRIKFLGTQRLLRHRDLLRRVVLTPWEDPRSLVLLMACGSAATDLASLVTMLETFAAAPAAAVIGTETPVVTSLVSHFAAELSLAMWRDRRSLGEAMTHVRRRLVEAANPLGFGFSAYGNADLKIAG